MLAALLIFRSGLLDPFGKPLGTDFLSFYAGSQLALDNQAENAYNYPNFESIQSNILGEKPPPLYWLYPPTFFLFVLPLALLPYIYSWITWLFLTGVAYCTTIRKICPDPLTLTVTLAYPGTIQNILQGQNGFLSAALIGGGLLLLPKRPIYAGILLGMMTYKPHLAILLPFALIAGRQWYAIFGFAIGSAGLIVGSVVVFGLDIWIVYVNNFLHAAHVLQSGGAPLFKAPTTYAFFVLLGLETATARIFQIAVSLVVFASVVWLWNKQTAHYAEKASALAIATLLFTPSAYDYDLAILAVPIAFIASEIMKTNGCVYEKWILVSMWALPFLYPNIAAFTNIQIAPIMLALFFGIVLFRAKRSAYENFA
jgi:hypothetical protein